MDVPEMVERVARAICTADGYDPDYDGDIGFGPNKAWYEKHARAAIEAMRKPTQDMLDATGGECRRWAPGAWDLMIEAALSPSLKEQEREKL